MPVLAWASRRYSMLRRGFGASGWNHRRSGAARHLGFSVRLSQESQSFAEACLTIGTTTLIAESSPACYPGCGAACRSGSWCPEASGLYPGSGSLARHSPCSRRSQPCRAALPRSTTTWSPSGMSANSFLASSLPSPQSGPVDGPRPAQSAVASPRRAPPASGDGCRGGERPRYGERCTRPLGVPATSGPAGSPDALRRAPGGGRPRAQPVPRSCPWPEPPVPLECLASSIG